MLSSRFCQFFRHLNLTVLAQFIRDCGECRLPGLAAEMAYSNVFALFPTLIGLLAAIGTLDIAPDTVDFVVRQLLPIAPVEVVRVIKGFVQSIQIPEGRVVVVISIIIAVWSASGAVSTAMGAMDQIHQIPLRWRRPFWQARLISILLTGFTVGFIFMASFLVFISDWLLKFGLKWVQIPGTEILQIWFQLRWLLAFSCVAFAFIVLYRYGVSVWRSETPLLPGAILAAILWAVVSQFLRIYLAHFGNFNVTYGTLSAGIVLLLWLNWSSLVVLLGAQLNVTVGAAMQQQLRRRYINR